MTPTCNQRAREALDAAHGGQPPRQRAGVEGAPEGQTGSDQHGFLPGMMSCSVVQLPCHSRVLAPLSMVPNAKYAQPSVFWVPFS